MSHLITCPCWMLQVFSVINGYTHVNTAAYVKLEYMTLLNVALHDKCRLYLLLTTLQSSTSPHTLHHHRSDWTRVWTLLDSCCQPLPVVQLPPAGHTGRDVSGLRHHMSWSRRWMNQQPTYRSWWKPELYHWAPTTTDWHQSNNFR